MMEFPVVDSDCHVRHYSTMQRNNSADSATATQYNNYLYLSCFTCYMKEL